MTMSLDYTNLRCYSG